MTALVLDSKFSKIDNFFCDYGDTVIKNEGMLFSCNIEHARKDGGILTTSFLNALERNTVFQDAMEKHGGEAIIDSRVHMLMPGWYPCIPGWHHDDVDRGGLFNQPQYGTKVDGSDMQEKIHFMGLANAEIAPTEFIVGQTMLVDPDPLPNVYEKWHTDIQWAKMTGHHKVKQAESGVIYAFNQHSMHRGTQAVKNGWRWFIRVTVNSNRQITNELRNQVQAYLPVENKGW